MISFLGNLFRKYRNFISKERSRLTISFVTAVTLTMWCNSFAVFRYFKTMVVEYGFFYGFRFTIAGLLLVIGVFTLVFLVCSISKFLFKSLIVICILLAAAYNSYVYVMNLYVSDSLLRGIILATKDDISSGLIINLPSVSIFIISILPLIDLYFLKFKKISINFIDIKKFLIRFFTIFLSIIVIAIGLNGRNIFTEILFEKVQGQIVPMILLIPVNRTKKTIKLAICLMKKKECNETKYQSYDEEFFLKKSKNKTEPLIAIFLIGESLRSNRLSVNGYNRETTPLMKKNKNLYAFKNIRACGTNTAISVPCMLSNFQQDTYDSISLRQKKTLCEPLTKLDFDTNWYSIQNGKNFSGCKKYFSRSEILSRAPNNNEDDPGDMIFLKFLKENEIQKNTVYFVHTRGSHKQYYDKYSRKYAKFLPDFNKSYYLRDKNERKKLASNSEAINNAYDNTVYYLDVFIDQLTQKLKDKNAFIFYVSDHGESLGENGNWFHGAPMKNTPKEQLNVPMIIWTSDKFAKNNPEKIKNIKEWQNINQDHEGKYDFRHDNVFHTFLDCLGVESKAINKEMSMCGKYTDKNK